MATETKEYKYKYPNESFSGCDMVASIVYGWDRNIDEDEQYGKGGKSVSMNATQQVKSWNIKVLGEVQTISYSIHMEKRPVRSIGNVNAKDYVMGPRTIAGSLVFAVFNKHFAEDIIRDHNDFYTEGTAYLVDELPPFNIVISMANEYGIRSKMVIYGVRLLNEGQVMSVNDVYTENTYQFVATDIEYLNDEVTYASRDKYNGLIKIKDILSARDPDWFEPLSTRVLVKYHDPENEDIEKIIMNVSTVDATLSNPYGKATISLSPTQTEGEITIYDSENKKNVITIDGRNSYSIDLLPDIYNASFNKPNAGHWTCNGRSFIIKSASDKYDKKKYAPIIEVITDTSLTVYSNESTHTHVAINVVGSDTIVYHELKSRRVKITDLQRNTYYNIATCNGPETTTSPYIKVRTFTVFEKPFNDFVKMVETNSHLLKYSDLARYFDIIEQARIKAANNDKFESPTNSIVELKKKFESELNALDPEDAEYNELYTQLTYNIHVCNELIYLSNKVQNNIISIVNKETEIPVPTLVYDKSYDTVFVYDKTITKSEFYRIYKNMSQSAATVYASTFSTIDDNENSFRFRGKSGTNHYVQALVENARSPKLEFYEMTLKEKQERMENDSNVMTDSDINKVQSIILDEVTTITDSSMLDRLFMSKIKNLESPKILDPSIVEITEEYIDVETKISQIIDDQNEYYYLAVSNKEDIINNDFIYKCKFNSEDDIIRLEDIDYALYKNKDYCIWIEDSKFNQISNATTFTMNVDGNIDDRAIFEYEIDPLLNQIKTALSPYLPTTIYETLCSYIEYNEDTTKNNIVDTAIEYILYSGLGQTVIINCLKAIKNLIGCISDSDDIISNIDYSNKILSFDSSKDVNTLTISFNENDVEYQVQKGTIVNIEDIDSDYVIAVGLSSDLLYKTAIMFIDKNANKMEVL